MKKVQQRSKERAGIIGMVCLLAVMLSSCLKDQNNSVPIPPAALVSVINASPDADPVDFYLQPNKANNYPIRYGHGIDYVRATPGKRTITFTIAGNTQKIAEDTVTLTADKLYSVFLANVTGKRDIIFLADSIIKPAAGLASIRLVNASADAGAVDLVTSADTVLAANKAYKGASKFVTVKGGVMYTLNIRKKGTTTILASITNVNLRAGSVYTIWLQGVAAATDDKKLTANLQTNVFYY